jgi:hypothetical protein
VHSREYVRFEENAAGPFHSDLPPLVDMVDDDEEASSDSETTSDSLDGPVDLPAENLSENVPAVSLAPLGNEFTIPLLDKLTLEMVLGFVLHYVMLINVRACVRTCVRACVRACVHACAKVQSHVIISCKLTK